MHYQIDQTLQSVESLAEHEALVPSPPSPARFRRPGRMRFLVLMGVLLLALIAIGSTTLLLDYHTLSAAAKPDGASKIDPPLQEAMLTGDGPEHLRIIIHMQPPPENPLADLPRDETQRRAAVAERLQSQAAQSQAGVQRELQQHLVDGGVTAYRSLWIINGLQATASESAIETLSARPDVSRITLDANIRLLGPMTVTESSGTGDLPWHLQRTRVQHVWTGLNISGTGATVAVMDTGADWLHPALNANYLGGAHGESPQHEIAWFDAVDGATEPFDPHGHGTHVIGTAAGRSGIGVAPGSTWMAVRILKENGSGSVGDIHAGFQWLLAPNGDPALAPDIVNGSWSARPEFVEFVPDIEALHAAGIITVFSAGNTGPDIGTVRAPANYPGVVAVAATDDIDEVAWFSSRGPSLWTEQPKPTIAAPGMQILSALPDERYGFLSGTSMAAPHVAGLYALLLSAGGDIDPIQATAILTATAVRPGGNQPDDDVGWGRADAYAALSSIVPAGLLSGQITGDGFPLPAAAITITVTGKPDLAFETALDGSFTAELISGTYALAATAYGYTPYVSPSIAIATGTETHLAINLLRLPFGTAIGQILDLDTGRPLSGTIRVTGTPVTATAGDDGRYAIELPEGEYELVAWALGRRLGRLTAIINAAGPFEQDFELEPGPKILLIDSGQWYGGSQAQAYEAALQQNDYAYSTLTVRDPINDTPTLEFLSLFDVVIWSAPQDSPGVIGAGGALSQYLDAGGSALISGQNVAEIDEGQPSPQWWWHQQLRGLYHGKVDAPFDLTGEPATVFEGLQIDLSDVDDRGRPVRPDASSPQYNAQTKVGLRYPDGRAAALLGGQCESFRLAYFGFGLEDLTLDGQRSTLMAATFDFFAQPETEVGLLFDKQRIDDLVPPGGQRTYPLELLNLSESLTDTIRLELEGVTWPARLITDTVEVGPCQSAATLLEVDVPSDLPLDTVQEIRVVASSTNFPEYNQSADVHLKTPGRILLVDDDRWYDQSATFKAAMAAAGYGYDFWENQTNASDPGSPKGDLLNAYEFIIWYTGYDWFRPITSGESEALLGYVEQGGRLFLTSQDYLYYHAKDRLTRDYLGVMNYAESVTPTVVFGGAPYLPFNDLAGPHQLEYGRYRNNSDGLVPSPDSHVSLWHDQGFAAGVATAGEGWRTVFWGVPMETLPETVHAKTLNRIIGWLGDLGDSTFLVDSRTGSTGSTRTYTLTLSYSPSGLGSMVAITNTLPTTLTIDKSTLSGSAIYNQALHQVTWNGHIDPGQEHQVSYEATLQETLSAGARIENRVEIYYDDHDLSHERTVPFWLNAPDMSASRLQVTPGVVRPGQLVTIELELVNQGAAAGQISASLKIPESLSPLTATAMTTQGVIELTDRQLSWHGWLQAGQGVTATLVLTAPRTATTAWFRLNAIVNDGLTDAVIVDTLLEVRSYVKHFPMVFTKRP